MTKRGMGKKAQFDEMPPAVGKAEKKLEAVIKKEEVARKKNWVLWVSIALVAIIIIVGLIYLLTPKGGEEKEATEGGIISKGEIPDTISAPEGALNESEIPKGEISENITLPEGLPPAEEIPKGDIPSELPELPA